MGLRLFLTIATRRTKKAGSEVCYSMWQGSRHVSPATAVFMFVLLPSFSNCFQMFPLTRSLRVTTQSGPAEWRRYADQIPPWQPDIVISVLCKLLQNLETTARIVSLILLWYHEKSYVNSTMGSLWPHWKKNHNINTVYYNVLFPQIIFHRTGLYSNIDK